MFTVIWGIHLILYLLGHDQSQTNWKHEIIVHGLPWLSTQIILYTGDISLVEADWRYCIYRSLLYFVCSMSGYLYRGIGVYQ